MFGDETLLSVEGVQQGDPDGPRLFGDTINSLIQSLQSRFNVWYLDDGNLADEYRIVLGDLRDVIEEGRKCGLVINPAKSELFFLGTESDESRKQILSEFSEVCCGIQTPPLENLTVLGAPIGASAIISCLGDKIVALRILANRLPHLDSHHAFYLLKHSFAIPRLTYSLRTAPCFDHPKLLEDYDSVLRSALKDVCNVHINDSAWVQACLPVRVGGLGLNSTMQLAPSAFLASAAACADLSSHLFDPIVDIPPPTIRALEAWKSTIPLDTPFPTIARQRAYLDPVYKSKLSALRESSSPTGVARLNSLEGPVPGCWLDAIPASSLGLKLTNSQFRISVAIRLGCKVTEPHSCSRCGKEVLPDGLHGLSCIRSAGRLPRHAMLNDIVRRALASCGVPSILEPPGLCRGDGKRVDGVTLVPWTRGRTLTWDATIVDPLAPSHIVQTAATGGHAVGEAEALKIRKYQDLIDRGYLFHPVAFETFGRPGAGTAAFVREIGSRLETVTREPRSHRFLLQRCTIAIMIGNAASIMGTVDPSQHNGLYDQPLD